MALPLSGHSNHPVTSTERAHVCDHLDGRLVSGQLLQVSACSMVPIRLIHIVILSWLLSSVWRFISVHNRYDDSSPHGQSSSSIAMNIAIHLIAETGDCDSSVKHRRHFLESSYRVFKCINWCVTSVSLGTRWT